MVAQARLVFLFLNLVFIRLVVLADLQAGPSPQIAAEEIKSQGTLAGSIGALDQINSLEHAGVETFAVESLKNGSRSFEGGAQERPMAVVVSPTPAATGSRRRSRAKSSAARRSQQQQPASGISTVASMVANVLSQLERVDLKRVLADLAASTPPHAMRPDALEQRSAATDNSQQQVNHNKSSISMGPAASNTNQQRNGKLNVSALTAESGNLLSITKQLVKLARNQVLSNGDFGQYFSGAPLSSSWSAASAGVPMTMPSMLSAASHAFHDSLDLGGHHTGATLKSEWFWWVAPAVIVIGTGVIVVPLIAAWLVSQAMSQNTFTVSAGRRRRRRSAGPADFSLDDSRVHLDLFKMLDIHRLLDNAPDLLADQLSKFHEALENVGHQFMGQRQGRHKEAVDRKENSRKQASGGQQSSGSSKE